jgi:hypothetical protein
VTRRKSVERAETAGDPPKTATGFDEMAGDPPKNPPASTLEAGDLPAHFGILAAGSG